MSTCVNTDGWKNAQLKTKDTIKQIYFKKLDEYNLNPTKCKNCLKPLSYNSRKNKFCNKSCSATFNNKGKCKNVLGNNGLNPNDSKDKGDCIKCGKKLTRKSLSFCSIECSSKHKMLENFNYWESNFSDFKYVPRSVRFILLERSNYKCCLCGWGEKNVYSNTYPLIIDHIDGNSENNNPNNLRIICPNCDSLTSTYKSLNKGNGRYNRRQRYELGKSY